ncbi:alpha/beta-hydrolase [Dendrothele bispora CBS 962.96]|uniref:Alpha/beta-hydrolase n=1 Tax=Dendrothele bispora (strain CBS 962.96) TaxID=1314807 RepID=A0A4S8M7U3_DENBC|nr:alpha/beta-hydrolase [Dendrothele bispora CBS 962.96]
MLFTSLTSLFLSALAVKGVVVPQASVSDHIFAAPAAVPTGQNVTIAGVNTYVSLPKGDFDKSRAVVILMDVFGFGKTDNFTDTWADAGFATYMPDYLLGDPLPQDNSVPLDTWIMNHTEAITTPPLLAVLDALKTQGVNQIGVSGYCFGGLYATRLTQNNTVTVATMAHPSLLVVPDDYELVKAQSRVPVQINSAEFDTGLTPALADEIDQVMVGYVPGYNHTAFAGVGHGFAVSANASDPVQVAAKEGAFNISSNWIRTHFV